MFKTRPSNTGDVGLIPGWGAKIPLVSRSKKQNTMKQCCNKFKKDLKKKSPYQNNLKKIVIVILIGSSLEGKVARWKVLSVFKWFFSQVSLIPQRNV